MKAKAIVMTIVALILTVILFVWFIPNMTNKQIWDMTFSFEQAIIRLPDDSVVKGKVASWKDFEDGDQVQIKMDNGHTYLTHISNVCLISE